MKQIAIICFDIEYVAAIEYKIAKNLENIAFVSFVTDAEVFQMMEKDFQAYDLLILPERISLPEAYCNVQNIYYLTEQNQDNLPANYIYKYVSAENMAETIKHFFNKEVTQTICVRTKLLSVFSVAGGTGKTFTALGIAHQLVRRGRKVLYVSTVPYQDFSYYIDYKGTLSTNFVRQCAVGIKGLSKLVAGEIRNETFDFLPAFLHLPMSYHIGLKAYRAVIEEMMNRKLYDYIIVELSQEPTIEKLELLKKSDAIIVTTKQDELSVRKLEAFFSNVMDLTKDIKIVCNHYRPDKTDYLLDSVLKSKYRVVEYVNEYDELTWPMVRNSYLYQNAALGIES